MNLKFEKEIKRVYAEIDKYSNLQWAAKDDFELIWKTNGRQNTRSRIDQGSKDASEKWQKNTNAQFGYGEITRVSIHINWCADLFY